MNFKLAKFSILYLILGLCITSLVSCEGFIKLKGTAYDIETKQPINNVTVILILKKNDTVRLNQLEYDTLDYKQRLKLREKKVNDDFKFYDPKGLSKFKPAVTDSFGIFSVGNLLVGCIPKCPECRLVFIKDGYKKFLYKSNSIAKDSIKIFLEKDRTANK